MTLAPRAGFEPGTYRLQRYVELNHPTSLPATTFEIAVRDYLGRLSGKLDGLTLLV